MKINKPVDGNDTKLGSAKKEASSFGYVDPTTRVFALPPFEFTECYCDRLGIHRHGNIAN
ncbi:hypothetical protein KIN20_036299 [Parelaphostrongylus tenuis]|uniref:Uncharacterized protein n=1 Tax=Parelaphostrongylus tenuis TaxID=148309 RepID=A0AAD5WL71_PARTN|nr:hypothetical protein KIN20_036299 [Parelaphostrongylus tenuis]